MSFGRVWGGIGAAAVSWAARRRSNTTFPASSKTPRLRGRTRPTEITKKNKKSGSDRWSQNFMGGGELSKEETEDKSTRVLGGHAMVANEERGKSPQGRKAPFGGDRPERKVTGDTS